MRLFGKPLASLVLLIGLGSSASCAISQTDDWVKIDAKYFEFFVPEEVQTIDVVGFDSHVGEFQGSNFILTFDYGRYSSRLDNSGWEEYTSHVEDIGGKKAKVASFYFPDGGYKYDYAIGVYFSQTNTAGSQLMMLAVCQTSVEYETMKAIFRTIRFL